MSLYAERAKGQQAESILKNPVWSEAWEAYRQRILEEIERAPSSNTDAVMHLKRLLSACTAAKAHMERIMAEGSFAAKSIELEEKQRKFKLFK